MYLIEIVNRDFMDVAGMNKTTNEMRGNDEISKKLRIHLN
jgi:hypothetical protein